MSFNKFGARSLSTERCCTSSAVDTCDPSAGAGRRAPSAASLPTIIAPSCAASTSCAETVATTRPRRRTVILSAIARTSSSLCPIRIMPTPCFARSRRICHSFFTSSAERRAAGSSRMRTRGLPINVLISSTCCCSPTESRSTCAVVSSAKP